MNAELTKNEPIAPTSTFLTGYTYGTKRDISNALAEKTDTLSDTVMHDGEKIRLITQHKTKLDAFIYAKDTIGDDKNLVIISGRYETDDITTGTRKLIITNVFHLADLEDETKSA